MTTKSSTPTITRAACPKCSGTGIVAVFAHVKNGVCFDCDGTGTIAAAIVKVIPKLGTPGPAGLAAARIIADAFIADPTSVGHDLARAAFDTYEATFRGQWTTADYTRRNELAKVVA